MAASTTNYDVIVIGAGVAGIYQAKRLADLGLSFIVLEGNADLGGTWYKNRYPGCRFDSESYTYGYSFSRELLDEWHWKEMFSSQPENLKYLNFVADKFDLRRHIQFNTQIESMTWDEEANRWTLLLQDGEVYTTRFVITCIGVLSAPSLPNIKGREDFAGPSFHTFDWPDEPVDLSAQRVGIIGTGATGIQVIAEIADKVGELFVFQKEPNWSVPLNNAPIDDTEMAKIRAQYDEIFANCAMTNGGFEHVPDRRGYDNVTDEERRALWDDLYDRPGFSLLLANFPETFLEERANRDLSDYVAERIRQRVNDPDTAERLIPKDHGFGMRRLPLETNYFEAYNRENVHLVDLSETPIERITAQGIQTTAEHYALDLIVYATGFNAVMGAFNRIQINGHNGLQLQEKWRDETSTYLGIMTHGFPNMLMVAGPQSVSGSTNYPRAIEMSVDWVTDFLKHALDKKVTRFEATSEAEKIWTDRVVRLQERMPFSKVKSWFTGYSPNAISDGSGTARYNAYWGGAPKYKASLDQAAADNYAEIDLA